MIQVSVVVPVYNAERHLKKCLDSLEKQLIDNVEFILVDDGSGDCSFQICKMYAAKDSRFVVLHKENGGSVSARNAGIDIAQGQYIAFIDSDDYVDDAYIRELYESLVSQDADIAIKSYVLENGLNNTLQQLQFPSGIYEGEKKLSVLQEIIASDIQGGKSIYSALWGKMYKTSLIRNHYKKVNPMIREGEDLVLFAMCCTTAEKIYLDSVESSKYHYVQNSEQVTKCFDSEYERRVECLFDNLVALNKEIHFVNFEEQFEKLVIFYTCKGFENIYYRKSNISYLEIRKRIHHLCSMANKYVRISYNPNERIAFKLKRRLIKHSMVSTISILYLLNNLRK